MGKSCGEYPPDNVVFSLHPLATCPSVSGVGWFPLETAYRLFSSRNTIPSYILAFSLWLTLEHVSTRCLYICHHRRMWWLLQVPLLLLLNSILVRWSSRSNGSYAMILHQSPHSYFAKFLSVLWFMFLIYWSLLRRDLLLLIATLSWVTWEPA